MTTSASRLVRTQCLRNYPKPWPKALCWLSTCVSLLDSPLKKLEDNLILVEVACAAESPQAAILYSRDLYTMILVH